jgi:hypothetical protein
LADVSSFANSDGGVLVYGVRAPKGAPVALPGIALPDIESTILRLQALAREHLDPPLTRLFPHTFNGPEGAFFLVLEIPRSLLAPHGVWLDRDGRFWRRNTSGKYQMDVHELRQAFSLADAWLDQASAFRSGRIAAIAADYYSSYAFPSGFSAIVVHSIPLGRNRHWLDIDGVTPLWKTHFVLDPGFSVPNFRYTVDGALMASNDGNLRASLIHCHRTGVIEQCVALHQRYSVPGDSQLINGCALERDMRAWLAAMLEWQRAAELEPPIALFISLLSVNGRRFAAQGTWAGFGPTLPPFDHRDIQLPEVVVTDDTPEEAMRAVDQCVTLLWQTAGAQESPC